ncbi:MAG: murein DD-endopeptidase MepM/ murein hydrolase activator NlpD [Dokdonia sp.]|jgi:murein DD-endopeptidase MepM/ murein hydrolase activator NlpD
MRTYLILFLICVSTIAYAKHDVNVYYEKTDTGYVIYADNNEFCPVSVKLEFTLTNLTIPEDNNSVYVIQPRQKKQVVTQLSIAQKSKGYKFSYKSWVNYGDDTKDHYDSEYVYDLPFAKAQSYKVHQGYNGTFSHHSKNALDFDMPIGAEVHAIRDGIVTKIVEKHNQNCGTKECKQYNNLIIIYQPDGTFAEYTHLKQQGADVVVGDIVTQGQLIGYSGHTGWSTGPHLHLEVFLQKLHKRETLQTKFSVNNGKEIIFLKEKNSYLK